MGALALPDGRLLSWSYDDTLRLWDSHSGACLADLKDHTGMITSVQVLSDGRLLSSSLDKTLRLWDPRSGTPLTVLEGHTEGVENALKLPIGCILSWSFDNTLRLWDARSGTCLAVFKGHTDRIDGALALPDDHILSWSIDRTLRLWDGQTGECLALLEGAGDSIKALALDDGRLLSWSYSGSNDWTLRLWDGQNGTCLKALEGHTSLVKGALVLPDGQLLSWSHDNTLRLWDRHSGACLDVVAEEQVASHRPEWLYARTEVLNSDSISGDFFIVGDFFAKMPTRKTHLRHKSIVPNIAAWNAESHTNARCLLPDGTVVVTQANDQVCILKLYHGNRRVSLAEAEEILALQMKQTE
jgi:WD40 repeat protein